jgi:hypothetical protein
MAEAQCFSDFEIACARRCGTVGPLFLLMILIVLMILRERMDAQVKIRSTIKSMSMRFDPPAQRRAGSRARYFFGSAIAWAATHCHSPFRSTQVSVKR